MGSAEFRGRIRSMITPYLRLGRALGSWLLRGTRVGACPDRHGHPGIRTAHCGLLAAGLYKEGATVAFAGVTHYARRRVPGAAE